MLDGGMILLCGILKENVNLDPPLDELIIINKDGDKYTSEMIEGVIMIKKSWLL